MNKLESTIKQLRSLRLAAIADQLPVLLERARDNDQSHLSLIAELVEYELAQRNANRIRRNYKQARFPANKRLEQFDFQHQTTITKREVNELLDFNFIDERRNVIFIGPPGVGKTHLAISIGIEAVSAGYKVLFKSALDLVEELELAEMKGELKKRLTQLGKYDLLIIDELGYLPMNSQSRYNLFQLINSLYEYRSIILTTNKNFASWAEFFHNDAVAVPIVDRIIHHSHLFMLGGESYRLKAKMKDI